MNAPGPLLPGSLAFALAAHAASAETLVIRGVTRTFIAQLPTPNQRRW